MARGRWRPHVTSWDDFAGEHPVDDPVFYNYKILAEGDSWFTLGGIPTSNILFSLRFKKSTIIASCAQPGDTVVRMSDILNNRSYFDACTNNYKWDAILLSCGGNDLIKKAGEIIQTKKKVTDSREESASDYCNESVLSSIIIEIQDGYRKLASIRSNARSSVQDTPIIVHTYDYPTPRNSPARFFSIGLQGPWIYNALTKSKVPDKHWLALSDYLIDRLADGILDLANGPERIPNFYAINTRGLLKRAKPGTLGMSNDWLNEIHPTQRGYRKISAQISETIHALLS